LIDRSASILDERQVRILRRIEYSPEQVRQAARILQGLTPEKRSKGG
jgi:hypothetical protein